MGKVKQETFSNFHYEMIKSIDNRCADVKCTYVYQGKTLTHYFSYAKNGKKPDSYYISKAKADMDKIVKEKSPETVANKDLNAKKATFFKRHKKPILATTVAVLVAGVAVAATLVTLKFMQKTDPTAVSEEEIDRYIAGPTGDSKQISPLLAENIVKSALYNYENNSLKNVETKWISSRPVNELINKALKSPGSNPAIATEDEVSPYNDTTGFYTDNMFKSKNYYKSYLNGRILKDTKDSKAATIFTRDNLETVKDNISSAAQVETNLAMKGQLNKNKEECPNDYIAFINGKYNYDGYAGDNLQMSEIASGFDTLNEAGEYVKDTMTNYSRYLTMFTNSFVLDYLRDYIDDFRVTEKDSIVYLKLDLVKENIVQPQILKKLNIMGIPVNAKVDVVWTFKNIGEDGWVLDTFACEGYSVITNSLMFSDNSLGAMQQTISLIPKYVEYNDKGEKLSEPVCINKDKMFTRLTYGDLDTDEEISKISYNGKILNESPFNKVMGVYYADEETANMPDDIFEAIDYTKYRRIENSEFDGFSHYGTIAPTGKLAQCVEGSGVAFVASAGSEEIALGYEELKSYLDKDLFEKGWEIKNDEGEPTGYYTIKLKKAGWFNFELVFNNKLEVSNLLIDFHDGPSPLNPTKK